MKSNIFSIEAVLCLSHIAIDVQAKERFRLDVTLLLKRLCEKAGGFLESCQIRIDDERVAGIELAMFGDIDAPDFFSMFPVKSLESAVNDAVHDNSSLCDMSLAKRVSVKYSRRGGFVMAIPNNQTSKNGAVIQRCIAEVREEVNWDAYKFDEDVDVKNVVELLLPIQDGRRKIVLAMAAFKAVSDGRDTVSRHDLQNAIDVMLKKQSDVDGNYIEQLASRFIPREPKNTFASIILPKSMLQELDIATSLSDEAVLQKYNEWGLAEVDPNPRAILNFYGPPGTGKTHAAEALAHKLGKKIIIVGCKELESKWLGEGPKNVAAAFLAARRSDAVLFFDEADGLISQRQLQEQSGGENQMNAIKNAMLTEVETHRGIVIFASNFVEKYDSAFATRIQSFEFVAPTKDELVKIWETKIPARVPGRDAIDFESLADLTFNHGFCGRDVRNAAVRTFKTILHKGGLSISQNDLVFSCNALIAERKKMEQCKHGSKNTMIVSPEDDDDLKTVSSAMQNLVKKDNNNNNEVKEN